MPPKRKDLPKANPKTRAKLQEPQSESDFLEAADDFEQAAGKWRAGDAAKALRFYNRAIDTYNTGLQRYPTSFDLAYNKANLEYNMIQDEKIVPILGSRIDLLQETLRSHRFAMGLNPEIVEIVFNTGQVLTSLAEALLDTWDPEARATARQFLEEAVALFTKSLLKQQEEYEQMQTGIANAQASQEESARLVPSGDVRETGANYREPSSISSSVSEAPEEWATVVEPVTPDTILDTCTAQLGAYTTLLDLYSTSDYSSIELQASHILNTAQNTIPAYIDRTGTSAISTQHEEPAPGPVLSIGSPPSMEEHTSPKEDALLARANFYAALVEVKYRNDQCTTPEYASETENIYAPLLPTEDTGKLSLSQMNALSAYADALFNIASAISDSPRYTSSSQSFSQDLDIQWTTLTQAQTILTKLSTGPHASVLPFSQLSRIFLARGDTDLFRFRLSLLESAKPAWVKSKNVLVSNAGVFYRGARTYAEKAGVVDVHKTADAKAIVAEVLKEAVTGSGKKDERWKVRAEDVTRVLQQMVEEGVIDKENAEGVVGYL
ncbi:uncharacterized protein EI97DRAFT_84300 [Westerdykella ornata]|uniref:TPR-like protein n=1 Tax=Westerdykella ornata TaxID=318751 RepID=A0A6A6JH78_WESOR|nr:uncharacterized protein EI97DRAFT_84300 [Westerdykella ornata]KAF2274996.1 hypothetical protein EI97DRAFT_84300 [Westerdykella ornata]